MDSRAYSKAVIITLLCYSATLMSSEQEVQKFFKAADNGFYVVMNDSVQKGLITPHEISSVRISGNTMISAALLAYPLASKKYGQAKAAQLLYEMLASMLLKLPKQDSNKLLNTQNSAGMTPLFIAAQMGLLKIVILLHDKGASTVTKDGRKASRFAQNNAAIMRILQQWEDLEGDWVILPG